jgi:cytidylate kinase
MGGLFRTAAAEHHLGIEEFYASLKNDPALERSMDQQQINLMKTKSNLVVQRRISWLLAKQSPFPVVNVFLAVDPQIGAERKIKEGVYPNKTLDEVLVIHKQREHEERIRYRTLYDIENFLDPKQYDFLINTSKLNEAEVLEKILKGLGISGIEIK